jgi:hypothetical protein
MREDRNRVELSLGSAHRVRGLAEAETLVKAITLPMAECQLPISDLQLPPLGSIAPVGTNQSAIANPQSAI